MTVEAPGPLVIETIASFLLFPVDISSAVALFSVNKHFRERFANMHSFWRDKCAEFGFSFERTKTEGLTWFELFRYCWTRNINVHVLMRDGACSSTKKRTERYFFFGLFLRRPELGERAAGDVSASIAEETAASGAHLSAPRESTWLFAAGLRCVERIRLHVGYEFHAHVRHRQRLPALSQLVRAHPRKVADCRAWRTCPTCVADRRT
jgi:hypothetical protein